MAPGIHLVHKPIGPTSSAVLETVRGDSPLKMCHAGALDPFAEGLLLVLAGEATRLFNWLHGVPKVYVAEVVWGVETDTGDPGGAVVAEGDARGLTVPALDAALAAMVGWREQVPPATSNKRVDGERAYLRAHRGEEVVLPASRVYVHAARWLRHSLDAPEPRSTAEFIVAGGTYVRSLARDLGRAMGARAHLAALRRTRIGPWDDPGPDHKPPRIQGERLLPWAPSRRLTESERRAVRLEAPVPRGSLEPASWPLPVGFPPPPVRLVHGGRLIGLADEAEVLTVRVSFGRGL